jgi:sulfofructose kinase
MVIKKLNSPSDTFDISFPEAKAFDVVGFGTNSVDYLCVVPEYPPLGSKTEMLQNEKLAGGQVATALTFLSRMGLKTKYVGKVGGDELGRFCMDSFASDSVDTSSIIVEQGVRNQVACIVIDKKSGERTVLSQRERGLDFKATELRRDHVCAGRILHLDGYDTAGSIAAATWCREEGIPVSIDLDKPFHDCEALIRKIDFLIVSSNFPVEFTGIADPGRAFEELGKSYDGFLAVTLGSAGAMAWVGDRRVTFPGLKLAAIDTTGAGDIFHGSFLYGLLQNWSLWQIMRFANTAAGLSCGFIGARTGIRPLREIMHHMEQMPH